MSSARPYRRPYTTILALFGLFACNAAAAQPRMTLDDVHSGTLLLPTAQAGRYAPAPVQDTRAQIRVTGPIARALVTQRFRNPGDQWAEAIYAFPLPEDAAVDRLRMKVGERLIEGQIQERGKARKTYETAATEGRQASLVEQQRPNLFTTAVANIPPQGQIEVTIAYQQPLQWRDGAFRLRFPLAITPRYSPGSAGTLTMESAVAGGWSILPGEIPNAAPLARPAEAPLLNPVALQVDLDPGFALDRLESRYHPIDTHIDEAGHTHVELEGGPIPADRDFVLEWTPKTGEGPGAAFFTEHTPEGDYGLLMVMPPSTAFEGQRRLPREVLFVVDTSGSMGGESIRQARAALALALERLQPQDRFDVIEFNSETHALFPRPVDADPAHRAQALAFARGLEAEGGTEMAPALHLALSMPPDPGRIQQLVFITDGAVGNEKELLRIIHDQLGGRRLFTVGIGSAPNTHFMTEAAQFGRGDFTYIGHISEVRKEMEGLFSRLERPVLTGLRLDLPVQADILPAPLPDLYAGQPVVALMRLEGLPDQAVLEGNLGDLKWKNRLVLQGSLEQTGLGIQWARARIQRWLRAEALGEDPALIRSAILELALRHHLVSPHTSLVAEDITPVRPADAALHNHAISANLPAGWEAPTGHDGMVQIGMPQSATSYQAWLGIGAILSLVALGLLGVGWRRQEAA